MEYTKFFTIYRVCAILGVGISTFGIFFRIYLIPSYIQNHVLKLIALKDGSFMRNSWEQLSYSYEFDCYIFNVTNPDEIQNGAKPIVQEVGPFVYDVRKEKTAVVDHEEDDTLSYTMKRTYIFNPNKSKPLLDENELTLPHFMIFGTPNAILRSQPVVLRLVSRSMDALYNNPKSIFVKAKAKTFLFDGYELNCEGFEEFFAKVVCNDVKEFSFYYRMQEIRKDVYTTSVWGWLNDTVNWVGPTRINRGIENIAEIGKVVQYNNTNNFGMWGDEKCDKYMGTDGTMFRPFLSRNDILHVVYPLMGRSLTYRYDSKVKHHGIKCYRYTATMGTDLETNPDDKCYCLTPDSCPKDGVYEYWKVVKWGLLVSNPHFYLADPYYNDGVDGLNPKKEDHLSIIDVHPLTGIVVSARFRFQFNGAVTQQQKYRLLRNASNALMPFGWYEERFALPKFAIIKLEKFGFFIALQKLFAYGVILIGFALLGVGIVLEVMKFKESQSSK